MKPKSQPMRTCVGCGEPKAKRLERSLKHSVSKEIYEALQRDLQENE